MKLKEKIKYSVKYWYYWLVFRNKYKKESKTNKEFASKMRDINVDIFNSLFDILKIGKPEVKYVDLTTEEETRLEEERMEKEWGEESPSLAPACIFAHNGAIVNDLVSVQIQGETIKHVFIPRKTDTEKMLSIIKSDPVISKYLENKKIVKEIVVPNVLVNIALSEDTQ